MPGWEEQLGLRALLGSDLWWWLQQRGYNPLHQALLQGLLHRHPQKAGQGSQVLL